jgi:hypothetical protein
MLQKAEAIRLLTLADEWGGVAKLADALGVHRSTMYRYLGRKLEMPRYMLIGCNLLAEHVKVAPPFQNLKAMDEEMKSFFKKRLPTPKTARRAS